MVYTKKNKYEEIKEANKPDTRMSVAPVDEQQEMRTKIEEYKKKSPRIQGRELVYPNGERVPGSFASLIDLKQDWLKNNPDVVNPEKELLQSKRNAVEVKKQMDKEKTEAQIRGESIPLNTDPIMEAPADELTASILENLQKKEEQKYADKPGEMLNPFFGFKRVLPDVLGIVPEGGGIKKSILNVAGENKEFRAYLSDFSNYQNAQEIKTRMTIEDAEIQRSFELASNGYTKEADALFNKAIASKKRSYSQMKIISSTETKKWVDELIGPMESMESYFSEGGELNDRIALRNAKIAGQKYG